MCLPGVEHLLASELRAAGIAAAPEVLAGGVAFAGGWSEVYRANLESGLASHVLVRIAEFGARSLADLDQRGARVPWRDWLPHGTAFEVRAHCRRSRIYHSGAAEQRIHAHLAAQLGTASAAEPVRVRVRIHDNRCRISLDTTGTALHRRGWRLEPGRAPLREDLAHALLLVSGWDRRSTLIDPFVGSGTILIEAAALARNLPPGRGRGFAFEQFTSHDAALWTRVRESANARERAGLEFRILGRDRDAGAIAAARANAMRAGVAADLDLAVARLSELDPTGWSGRGAVVTNPPYGLRLGSAARLPTLYRSLGRILAARPVGWDVTLAAADRRLALRTGLELTSALLVDSGGTKIRALTTHAAGDSDRPPAPAPHPRDGND